MRRKLTELKVEHRALDDLIDRMHRSFPVDQLELQRLKRRKLQLKDQMAYIESRLVPDIIA